MDNVVKEMEDSTQRKKTISKIIEKRCENITYLRRIYEQEKSIQWLNIAVIDPKKIINKIGKEKIQKRAKSWFFLGLSLAPLVKIPNIPTYVRSLAQIMEEYEYYIEYMNSKDSLRNLYKTGGTVNLDNEFEEIKPKLHKVGNHVAYEFLSVFNVPCELSYFHIIFSLCDVLKIVYQKFNDECCSTKRIYETIIKLDTRLKNHFFGVLEKEVHKLAKKTVQTDTSDIESVFKAWEAV